MHWNKKIYKIWTLRILKRVSRKQRYLFRKSVSKSSQVIHPQLQLKIRQN